MKAPSSVVRYAASIIIAKYPDKPDEPQRRAVTDFMALLSKLFGLARSDPDTQSRDALTAWGQANFRVWLNADFAAASPVRWGPHMWRLMFKCAKRYTRKRRRMFWSWIQSLRYILPCSKCAWHFRRMLSTSYHKWQRVRKGAHLTRYFRWMKNTVRKRVRQERKKIYFGSKEKGEWQLTNLRNTPTKLTRRTKLTKLTKLTSTRAAIRSIQKSVRSALRQKFGPLKTYTGADVKKR